MTNEQLALYQSQITKRLEYLLDELESDLPEEAKLKRKVKAHPLSVAFNGGKIVEREVVSYPITSELRTFLYELQMGVSTLERLSSNKMIDSQA